tara:strand:+ start:4190 stop:4861 length:672 start_codon:yes stop_codon:yes gene_type:complete
VKDLIPKGATRVQVTDEVGKLVWRKPSDLRDTDTIKFNPNTGEPYVMYGSPGVATPQSAGTPSTATTTTSNAVISAIKSRKKDVLDKDEVVSVAKSTPESADILTKVIAGIAEESASLYFERLEAERKGESTSQISMRRVQALKAVGDTWLKKKEVLASTGVDLDSPAFKIIFTHIAETFRQACDIAGVRPEMSESVFAEFGRLVDDQDWVADAKAKLEKGES